ncbi:unnamed protein product [marine sediment metagenome]|uniref:Uncharacterized protein n=1 Tax=marine sediment metagenome TaxID=412755 RepID=X0YUF3_9ZZZZ
MEVEKQGMSIFRKKDIRIDDIYGLRDRFNEINRIRSGMENTERRLDLLIKHLELEEYKPDCTVKLRKVKK